MPFMNRCAEFTSLLVLMTSEKGFFKIIMTREWGITDAGTGPLGLILYFPLSLKPKMHKAWYVLSDPTVCITIGIPTRLSGGEVAQPVLGIDRMSA